MPPPPQPAHSVSPASLRTQVFMWKVLLETWLIVLYFPGESLFWNKLFLQNKAWILLFSHFILKWIQQFTSTRPRICGCSLQCLQPAWLISWHYSHPTFWNVVRGINAQWLLRTLCFVGRIGLNKNPSVSHPLVIWSHPDLPLCHWVKIRRPFWFNHFPGRRFLFDPQMKFMILLKASSALWIMFQNPWACL